MQSPAKRISGGDYKNNIAGEKEAELELNQNKIPSGDTDYSRIPEAYLAC